MKTILEIDDNVNGWSKLMATTPMGRIMNEQERAAHVRQGQKLALMCMSGLALIVSVLLVLLISQN